METKEQHRLRMRAWRKANPQKQKAIEKRYQEKNAKKRAVREKKRRDHLNTHLPELARQRRREKHLRDTYGIGTADYDRMLLEQNGLCAICQDDKNSKGKRYLSVDHCHSTKHVRGLLCDRCNRGLGAFLDNPDFLEKAKLYVLTRKPPPSS